MRSVSAKKRKERLLPLPSNVSKLGFKAKRIISESLTNEAELVVSWLPACDGKSSDVDIADNESIGPTLSDGGDEVVCSSTLAMSLELKHKIAHLKSIFGGGSEVLDVDVRADDEPDQEVVRSFKLQGTVDGTNEGVEADDLAVKELQGFVAATNGVAVNHEENTLESDLDESVSDEDQALAFGSIHDSCEIAKGRINRQGVSYTLVTTALEAANVAALDQSSAISEGPSKFVSSLLDVCKAESLNVTNVSHGVNGFTAQDENTIVKGSNSPSHSASEKPDSKPGLDPNQVIIEATNEFDSTTDTKVKNGGDILVSILAGTSGHLDGGAVSSTDDVQNGGAGYKNPRFDPKDPTIEQSKRFLVDTWATRDQPGHVSASGNLSVVQSRLVGPLPIMDVPNHVSGAFKSHQQHNHGSPCGQKGIHYASILAHSEHKSLQWSNVGSSEPSVIGDEYVGPGWSAPLKCHSRLEQKDELSCLRHIYDQLGSTALMTDQSFGQHDAADNAKTNSYEKIKLTNGGVQELVTPPCHIRPIKSHLQPHSVGPTVRKSGDVNEEAAKRHLLQINSNTATSLLGPGLTSQETATQPIRSPSVVTRACPSNGLTLRTVGLTERQDGSQLSSFPVHLQVGLSEAPVHNDIQHPSPSKLFSQLFSPAPGCIPTNTDRVFESGSLATKQKDDAVVAPEFPLDFVSHGPRSENLVLKVPYELVEEGRQEWETTMVGYFVGRNLPYSLVKSSTERFWSEKGLIDTVATESGFFFFTFSTVEKRDAALEGGPWYIASQPLILKPWKPSINLDKEAVHSIPIWVNLYGVPLEFWNPRGLSFIASFIGKPLKVDRMTASRRRISYARVCIEVSGDQDLMHNFTLETDNGHGETSRTNITVEYQWTPQRCSQCSSFGHDCSRSAMQKSTQDNQNARQFCTSNSKPSFHRTSKAEVGVWQVVTRKDKGKQVFVEPHPTLEAEASQHKPDVGASSQSEHIVESFSVNPSRIEDGSSNVQISNSFAGLIPYVYDYDDNDRQDEGSGAYVVEGSFDEEGPYVDHNDVIVGKTCDRTMSGRQKKKEAKMLFSSSRTKGRQRS